MCERLRSGASERDALCARVVLTVLLLELLSASFPRARALGLLLRRRAAQPLIVCASVCSRDAPRALLYECRRVY